MAEVQYVKASRIYPGNPVPAVNSLDLDISAAEREGAAHEVSTSLAVVPPFPPRISKKPVLSPDHGPIRPNDSETIDRNAFK